MHLLSYETICYQAQISYKAAIHQHLTTTIRRLFDERSVNYLFIVNKTGKNADKDRKNVYKDRKNADIKPTCKVTYQSTPQYGLVTVNNYCKLQDLAQETADQGQSQIHASERHNRDQFHHRKGPWMGARGRTFTVWLLRDTEGVRPEIAVTIQFLTVTVDGKVLLSRF